MEELSILELHNKLAQGETTVHDLTQSFLNRIEALDSDGPGLNAVIEVNPDALTIADALDKERVEKGLRGVLHGIPVMVKDNIDTGDHMQTTAGSLALEGNYTRQDATVVGKLREAGAIILAKTNLSEWANFRSPHSSSGWSSRGGQTRNPYVLDRNPCGSSSGSAVAVAANLCAAALGTETNGSIICPAQMNGIVGIKPTLGLLSRRGIIPIAHSQDTAGPMARTVADAAVLLGALTGTDDEDAVTAASEGHSLQDYTSFLRADGLQGARIGVVRSFFDFNPDVDAVMASCLSALKECGAIIVDPVEIETEGQFGKPSLTVLLYEFKADLNHYLSQLDPAVKNRSLQDIIAYNAQHKETVMPHFGQERMLAAQEKGPLTEKAYLDALADCRRMAREEGIDATLQKHNLDALIAPSGGPAFLTDWLVGDHHGGGSASPAAVAGYPNITVPAGYIRELPVGISFFSTAWQEGKLIQYAYAFEQATKVRKPPQFLPTLPYDV